MTLVVRLIVRLSVTAAACAFGVLLTALFAQFVTREVFSFGLIGADEVARISFVWCSLFAACAAWGDDALHHIDLLTRNLRRQGAMIVLRVAYGLISVCLAYLFYYGIVMAERALDQTTSTLELSGAWLYVPVPVSAGLMLLITIQRFVNPPLPHTKA